MWICSRCQSANKDGHAQCVACSAPRNVRRFGAGTPVSTLSVQAAAPERRMQPQAPDDAPPPPRRSPHTPKEQELRTGRAPGGLVRLAGLLLSLLLPLMVLLLAVTRYDAVQPVITSIFFKPDAAIPPFFSYLAYGFSTAVAFLLSLAPGLSLFALGRLAGGLRRR